MLEPVILSFYGISFFIIFFENIKEFFFKIYYILLDIKNFISHIFLIIKNILSTFFKAFFYIKNLPSVIKTNKYKEDLKRTQKEFEDLQAEFQRFEEYYRQEKAKWEEELKQQYQNYKREKESKREQYQEQKTYQEYKQEQKEKNKTRFVFDGKMDYTTALKVLNLKSNFTAQELKQAYYKKATQYHPDKQFNKSQEDIIEAGEYFKQVNSAFIFLKSKT